MGKNVNREKLITLIGEIKKCTGILSEYQKIDPDILIKDMEKMGSIKYYLIIAIEACIDICNHIAAKEYSGVPESYADCFRMLGERDIISMEMVDKFVEMAKFRNVLVHLYWKVNERLVTDFLKEKLHWFDEYILFLKKRYL